MTGGLTLRMIGLGLAGVLAVGCGGEVDASGSATSSLLAVVPEGTPAGDVSVQEVPGGYLVSWSETTSSGEVVATCLVDAEGHLLAGPVRARKGGEVGHSSPDPIPARIR